MTTPEPPLHPLRYAFQTNGPNLLKAFDAHVAKWEYTPGQLVQIFHHRPSTIRQMLRHERPLWALVALMLKEFLSIETEELVALYLANGPPELLKLWEPKQLQQPVVLRPRRTTCFLCRPAALFPLPE